METSDRLGWVIEMEVHQLGHLASSPDCRGYASCYGACYLAHLFICLPLQAHSYASSPDTSHRHSLRRDQSYNCPEGSFSQASAPETLHFAKLSSHRFILELGL